MRRERILECGQQVKSIFLSCHLQMLILNPFVKSIHGMRCKSNCKRYFLGRSDDTYIQQPIQMMAWCFLALFKDTAKAPIPIWNTIQHSIMHCFLEFPPKPTQCNCRVLKGSFQLITQGKTWGCPNKHLTGFLKN